MSLDASNELREALHAANAVIGQQADEMAVLTRERDIAYRALSILRTSPSILPLMSGVWLTDHQIIDLLDSARDGKEWTYKPDPDGIDWHRRLSSENARLKTLCGESARALGQIKDLANVNEATRQMLVNIGNALNVASRS